MLKKSNPELKNALILFLSQVLMYSIICINFRAVAQANYTVAVVTDFIFASLAFFVIKRIASNESSIIGWLGYAFGGVVGSLIGIYLSKHILGG